MDCAEPPVAAIAGYANYDEFSRQVEALAKPGLAEVTSLGTTLGRRKPYLITLSTGPAAEKPAILVVGNVHGPHLVGSELALRMARQMIGRAAKDETVRDLLEKYTFYFIPRPTPDASEAFFQRPLQEREGNLRPARDQHDPDAALDRAEVSNGDGLITMLRVADDTGRYRPDPDDARVLVPADSQKNEHGQYDLYVEGRHEDPDPTRAPRPDGVAFNRNFPFRYPYYQPLAGPHPVSEVETRAVADFAFDHTNIAIVFTFSLEDNLMRPWKPGDGGGRIKTALLPGDAAEYEFLTKKYRDIRGGADAPDSAAGEGSFSEWAYFQYGRWSLAARGWWIPKVEPAAAAGKEPAKEATGPGAELVNALRWFDREKIDAFVPWTPIQHPDFSGRRVEVGGFKPFLLLNPPAKELEALATKHTDFLVELARLMPEVKIHETKVEPLGGGIFRITATVVNRGYLPTASEMGQTTGEVYPLLLRLTAPAGTNYVKGTPRTELSRLRGGEKTNWTWLIRPPASDKPAQATLRVSAPAAGSDTVTVDLK